MRKNQHGLSLIELMVSLTLGLIVLSGVLVVFVNSSAARNEIERTTRQIENGRYAAELLSEDLRLAGFYGSIDPAAGSTTPAIAIPGTAPDPCSLTPADWVSAMRLPVQGYDATSFTSANCSLSDYKAGTDILVVRRARTCTANGTTCTPVATAGTAYLQVSACATDTTTNYVLAVRGATPFLMQTKACDGTRAPFREYYVHIYYIATNNGSGVSIPTLKRVELTGGVSSPSFTTVPLVEGIENLQFLYGLDTDNDGAPNQYVASPATTADWANVVTTQFFILARNIDTSPNYSDTKTYTLGKDASGAAITYTPSGAATAYRRHVYSGLVRIMNNSGRRDL